MAISPDYQQLCSTACNSTQTILFTLITVLYDIKNRASIPATLELTKGKLHSGRVVYTVETAVFETSNCVRCISYMFNIWQMWMHVWAGLQCISSNPPTPPSQPPPPHPNYPTPQPQPQPLHMKPVKRNITIYICTTCCVVIAKYVLEIFRSIFQLMHKTYF